MNSVPRNVVFSLLLLFLGFGLMHCGPSSKVLTPSNDSPDIATAQTIAGAMEFRLPGFQNWATSISPPDTSVPGLPMVTRQTLKLSYPTADNPGFTIEFYFYRDLIQPTYPTDIISSLVSSIYPDSQWVKPENLLPGKTMTWLTYPSISLGGSESMQGYGSYTNSTFLLITFHQFRTTGRQAATYDETVQSISFPNQSSADYFVSHDSLLQAYIQLDTTGVLEYFGEVQASWPYNPEDYFMVGLLMDSAGKDTLAAGYFKRHNQLYSQAGIVSPLKHYFPDYFNVESPPQYVPMTVWKRYKKYRGRAGLRELYYPQEFRLLDLP